MTLSKFQFKEIKKVLQNLESQLSADIETAKKSSQPVTLDQQSVGRVSRIDAIQQQQMQAASVRRLKQRLVLVKSAINRIEQENFGICAECEEPIPYDRLKVRPESPLCVLCANNSD